MADGFKPILARLVDGQALTPEQARDFFAACTDRCSAASRSRARCSPFRSGSTPTRPSTKRRSSSPSESVGGTATAFGTTEVRAAGKRVSRSTWARTCSATNTHASRASCRTRDGNAVPASCRWSLLVNRVVRRGESRCREYQARLPRLHSQCTTSAHAARARLRSTSWRA